jgi:hypothetical protein
MSPKPILPILEQAKELLDYNPDTGVFTWKVAPPRKPSFVGKEAGTNQHGYRAIKIAQESVLAHRLAWAWVHGEEPPAVLDHINRDKSDNRTENLRDGGESVNHVNRPVANKTGVAGVVLQDHRAQQPYYSVWFKRDNILPYTKDFFEAVCARKVAENQFWSAA